MNPLYTPRARMRFLFSSGYGWEDTAIIMLRNRPWATKQGRAEFCERVHAVWRGWANGQTKAASQTRAA